MPSIAEGQSTGQDGADLRFVTVARGRAPVKTGNRFGRASLVAAYCLVGGRGSRSYRWRMKESGYRCVRAKQQKGHHDDPIK